MNDIDQSILLSLKDDKEDFEKKESVEPNFSLDEKSILVFGEVQSGKTRALIKIIRKNSEEQPLFVVYLTGLKNLLLRQNFGRFASDFEKINKKMGRIAFNVKAKQNRLSGDSFQMKVLLKSITESIEGNATYIINELKRPASLEKLISIIKALEINCNYKILVIDDEGDEASLASKTKEKMDILTSLPNVYYISITATPFKNLILNDNIKIYDRFIRLTPWEGYCGLDVFSNTNCYVKRNDREIDYEDKKFYVPNILDPLFNWLKTTYDNNLDNSQILYNFDNVTEIHSKIQILINQWVKNQSNIPKILKKLKINHDEEFIKYVKKFFKGGNYITILNSSEYEEKVASAKAKEMNEGVKIIIGGSNVSRGVTFDNLIYTVMLNSPKLPLAGTLLQRARWFGNRRHNLDIIKVYLSKTTFKALEEMKLLNELTKEHLDGAPRNLEDKFDDLIANGDIEVLRI